DLLQAPRQRGKVTRGSLLVVDRGSETIAERFLNFPRILRPHRGGNSSHYRVPPNRRSAANAMQKPVWIDSRRNPPEKMKRRHHDGADDHDVRGRMRRA